MEANINHFIVVIAYVVIVFGISFWRSFGVKNQDDFMVAGRSAPAWLLVSSLICTWIGAGSLIGGGGRAYREGFSQLWMSAGAWLGIIIIYFLAARVRKISKYTVQDILEQRYHPSARVLGAIAVILGSTIIFAYQLRYGAFLLEFIFGWERTIGVLITGALIFIFTTTAGLKSILAMDMLNGALIILAIFIGLPIMLYLVGAPDAAAVAGGAAQDAGIMERLSNGIAHVTDTLPSSHFNLFGNQNIFWAFGVFFPTFFLLLGESSIYQKFFSAKSGKAAKSAVIGFFIGVVVVEIALSAFAVTSGTHEKTAIWRNTYAEFTEAADTYTTETDAAAKEGMEAVLDEKWNNLFLAVNEKKDDVPARPADINAALQEAGDAYKKRTDSINLRAAFILPSWSGLLLLAGGLAIVFSTGNSFMMAASTSFTRDIWQRYIRPKSSQREIIWIQRGIMVLLILFAVGSLTMFTTVWQMALAAYTIIGVTLTPVILAAFLWKRVTPAGGVASLAVGLIAWTIMVTLIQTGILNLDYDYIVYPAGGASILTLILVSLFTKPGDPEKVKPFLNSTNKD